MINPDGHCRRGKCFTAQYIENLVGLWNYIQHIYYKATLLLYRQASNYSRKGGDMQTKAFRIELILDLWLLPSSTNGITATKKATTIYIQGRGRKGYNEQRER